MARDGAWWPSAQSDPFEPSARRRTRRRTRRGDRPRLCIRKPVFAPAVDGRPSRQPAGTQIHAIYVLPGDGVGRSLDTDGTIEASVSNFQTWLKGQADGRALRIDTLEGQLDVSVQTLPETDAQLAGNGIFLRDAIERVLKAAGYTAPGRGAAWTGSVTVRFGDVGAGRSFRKTVR